MLVPELCEQAARVPWTGSLETTACFPLKYLRPSLELVPWAQLPAEWEEAEWKVPALKRKEGTVYTSMDQRL